MDSGTIAQTLQSLTATLVRRIPLLLAVYRFGSFGTANQRPDSDIDLGLHGEGPLNPVLLFDVAGELATLAGREVDLVDLVRCSTVMRAQVVATGERIYSRDSLRCELFADAAFSKYAYLNEARRGILVDVQTRGSVYGG